ncbi:MAG: methionyl-tRNA formyltransferase [Legionellales bacterium]|nr:methionyl-tRNA formyltransferase [Legionellales bacterium]
MKIIFAGTPDFAALALEKLIAYGHNIVAVYTQPDRAAGRGRQLQASAVKQFAEHADIPVCQPVSLRDPAVVAELKHWQAEVMVVFAYGLLIPKTVLDIPPLGCINIHPSLLPRWRGAAPIIQAILNGDAITGVSIMKMNEYLDTGDVYLQKKIVLDDSMTADFLNRHLALMGAELTHDVLTHITTLIPQPQNEQLATYASKINTNDAKINWQEDALVNLRKINAFNPQPGAFAFFAGQRIKFWQAHLEIITHQAHPGTLLKIDKSGILIACGKNALRVEIIQMPGKKACSVAELINGRSLPWSLQTVLE